MKSIPILLVVVAILDYVISSSITNPLGADGDVSKVIPKYFDTKGTKAFYESTPTNLTDVKSITTDECKVEFRFRWSTNVGSSVFSPPIIYRSQSGKKYIFQNTFYQYIEMIGSDGFKSWYVFL